jgi:hypothetical protein
MSFDPRLACRSYSSLALNIPNMDRFPLLVAKTAAKKDTLSKTRLHAQKRCV